MGRWQRGWGAGSLRSARVSPCIVPSLPEPIAGFFYCFSAAFERREEKKKRLEKHFEKQGREKCPSFPAAPSPPPAASACQLCLPMLPWPLRISCQVRWVLSPSSTSTAGCEDHHPDTPECRNGTLPPYTPNPSSLRAAARNLPSSPCQPPRHQSALTAVPLHPFPTLFAGGEQLPI